MTLHKMAPVDAAGFHVDGSANLAPETVTRRFQQKFVTLLSAARRAQGRRSGTER